MGAIKVFPNVWVQRFVGTATITGVVPPASAADSEETILRGRYRQFSGLSVGGLFTLDPSIFPNGFAVNQILASLPGITTLNFFLKDVNGEDAFAGAVTLATGNGYFNYPQPIGLVIPPGCSFKVVGAGALSGAGRLVVMTQNGMPVGFADGNPILGASNLPPGMIRP